ncbi:MAG: hypothetical protein ACR2PY_08000, partial [Salinispira sp.]
MGIFKNKLNGFIIVCIACVFSACVTSPNEKQEETPSTASNESSHDFIDLRLQFLATPEQNKYQLMPRVTTYQQRREELLRKSSKRNEIPVVDEYLPSSISSFDDYFTVSAITNRLLTEFFVNELSIKLSGNQFQKIKDTPANSDEREKLLVEYLPDYANLARQAEEAMAAFRGNMLVHLLHADLNEVSHSQSPYNQNVILELGEKLLNYENDLLLLIDKTTALQKEYKDIIDQNKETFENQIKQDGSEAVTDTPYASLPAWKAIAVSELSKDVEKANVDIVDILLKENILKLKPEERKNIEAVISKNIDVVVRVGAFVQNLADGDIEEAVMKTLDAIEDRIDIDSRTETIVNEVAAIARNIEKNTFENLDNAVLAILEKSDAVNSESIERIREGIREGEELFQDANAIIQDLENDNLQGAVEKAVDIFSKTGVISSEDIENVKEA